MLHSLRWNHQYDSHLEFLHTLRSSKYILHHRLQSKIQPQDVQSFEFSATLPTHKICVVVLTKPVNMENVSKQNLTLKTIVMPTKLENTTRPESSKLPPPPSQRTFAQSWMGTVFTITFLSIPILTLSILQAIPARTRLFISLGVCIVGGTGLMISDILESNVPAKSKDH